jgi:hypothetical protein
MNDNGERALWTHGDLECVMISCCAGAELQLRRTVAGQISDHIVLRELYPTKSDLYERSRQLESETKAAAAPSPK